MNLVLFIFLSLGTSLLQSSSYQRLSLQDFDAAIQKDSVQLIDVRTPEEFQEGHIPGAMNLNFYNPEYLRAEAQCLDPEKPVYLYCKLGGRSKKASKMFLELGFRYVYDLKGGFSGWQKQ
ncbi:MAG: rhodanese-like domain-containing protein [Flavobacteriaceae bacterium]